MGVQQVPDEPAFVLVHSPIVGPDTWEPVAGSLRSAGHVVEVPDLGVGHAPFGEAHAAAATTFDHPGPVVLVAHSGAGQLLPAVWQRLTARGVSVVGHVLVDAGLPTRGRSRLAQLADEVPEAAAQLRSALDEVGTFPNWSRELLADLVPDPTRLDRLVAGMRPMPHEYWTGSIPDVPGWDALPGGVVLLSPGYAATARHAQQQGWPVIDLGAANHFHLLVDPDTVASAILDVGASLR